MRTRAAIFGGAIAALVIGLPGAGCSSSDDPPVAETWETQNPVRPLPAAPLGTEDHVDFASVAGLTPEKVRLGRLLFFDTRLSKDGTISCASCHRPENAFSEPTPVSTGIAGQQGTRKAPTFLNGAFPFTGAFVYFWDGRATSLAEQAKGPVENPIEMGSTHAATAQAVAAVPGYRRLVREVYGDEAVTMDRIADAIAAYEATRLSGGSAWDRYKAGDPSALSERAKQGEALFFGKARCNNCHLGYNFTDDQFHNLGVGWSAETRTLADLGRFAVSGKERDKGAFKTPTLRDVSKHAPYMHDGSQRTLREVMEHYDRGGIDNPWLSDIMRRNGPLGLTGAEIDAVIEFLHALDGEGYQDTPPTLFP